MKINHKLLKKTWHGKTHKALNTAETQSAINDFEQHQQPSMRLNKLYKPVKHTPRKKTNVTPSPQAKDNHDVLV